jgi:hypothetical protein
MSNYCSQGKNGHGTEDPTMAKTFWVPFEIKRTLVVCYHITKYLVVLFLVKILKY